MSSCRSAISAAISAVSAPIQAMISSASIDITSTGDSRTSR
jgi:hypothetical protein